MTCDRVRRRDEIQKCKEAFGGMELFNLDLGDGFLVYTYVKHQIICLNICNIMYFDYIPIKLKK